MQRLLHTLLASIVLLALALSTQPAAALPQRDAPEQSHTRYGFHSNPDQDSGWHNANKVGGGCDPNSGACDSYVTPGAPTLFEYVPDRLTLNNREPAIYSSTDWPYPMRQEYNGDGHPTARPLERYGRDVCRIYDSKGTLWYLGYARGMWHHGASWTLHIVNGERSWSGPNGPHWVFEHQDRCQFRQSPPTPTPVSPTGTPTAGVVGFDIRRCTPDGAPIETWVQAWAGVSEWEDGQYGSAVSFTVPGQFTSVGYTVSSNNGWTPREGSGEANTGSTVVVVMTSSECYGAGTPTPTLPPPTPPPPPCSEYYNYPSDSVALLAPETLEDQHGRPVRLPTGAGGWMPTLAPQQTVFPFNIDRTLYADGDHDANKRDYDHSHETGMLVRLERQTMDGGWTTVAQATFLAHLTSDYRSWAPIPLREDNLGRPVTFGAEVLTSSPPWWKSRPSYRGVPRDALPATVQVAGVLAPGHYRWLSTNIGAGWGIGYGYSMKDAADGVADLRCPEGVRTVGYHFNVADAPLTIKLQRSNMAQMQPAPIAGARIQLRGAKPGLRSITTDSRGVAQFTWSERVPDGGQLSIVPDPNLSIAGETGAGNFIWKIEQTCGRAPDEENDLNRKRYLNLTGPCAVTLTYVPMPTYAAQVMRINTKQFPETRRPFAGAERWGSEVWEWSATVLIEATQGDSRIWLNQGSPDPATGWISLAPSSAELARAIVDRNMAVQLRVIDPQVKLNGVPQDWTCNQADVREGAYAARFVDDPCAWGAYGMRIQPALPSTGNYFLYKAGNAMLYSFAGKVLEEGSGRGVDNITLRIDVTQGTWRWSDTWTTSRSGQFAFSWMPSLGNANALAPTNATISMVDANGRSITRLAPGGVRPAQNAAGVPITVAQAQPNQSFAWTVPGNTWQNVTADRNIFYVDALDIPPEPPVAGGEMRLRLYSNFDPDREIYTTAGPELTWPQGEVLHFTPQLVLEPLADEEPGDPYVFRQRVAGWSFVKTIVGGQDRLAHKPDDYQPPRSGCRERAQPTAEESYGSDPDSLSGCIYQYKHTPTPADMAKQSHIIWSAFQPPSMRPDIYSYLLRPLAPSSLQIQVAVVVEVVDTRRGGVAIDPATGEPLRRTQKFEQAFAVNFVTPRSAR